MAQNNFQRKDLFELTTPGHSPPLREVKERTEAGTREEYCLPACLLIFLNSPEAPTCPGIVGQLAIKTMPHRHMPTGQADLGNSSKEIFPSTK